MLLLINLTVPNTQNPLHGVRSLKDNVQYDFSAGNEMYTERLSDAFSAMTYLETLEYVVSAMLDEGKTEDPLSCHRVCYLKLGLLCFAISEGPENGKAFYSQTFSLNPDASYRIKVGSYGCFLAYSVKEVQRYVW